jgi:uncharacterized membrane protein YsdA (DUF1294 family)/cold shock CspA family protein
LLSSEHGLSGTGIARWTDPVQSSEPAVWVADATAPFFIPETFPAMMHGLLLNAYGSFACRHPAVRARDIEETATRRGSMRHKGRITTWKPGQGFGFVTPAGGGEPVFLHITAFSDRPRAPVENEMVTYELTYDRRRRPRATNVRRSAVARAKLQSSSDVVSSPIALGFTLLFVLFVVAATLAGRLSAVILGAYGVASILAFLAYKFDKSAAQRGHWRTKESSLLLLGLAGGWPGAFIAQRVLRHKSRKRSFQMAFWGTVALNTGLLALLVSKSGSNTLEQLLR